MAPIMNNDDEKPSLGIKIIAPLWFAFRDLAVRDSKDLHVQYCELIQDAMIRQDFNEAYRLLSEGMARYDAASGELL